MGSQYRSPVLDVYFPSTSYCSSASCSSRIPTSCRRFKSEHRLTSETQEPAWPRGLSDTKTLDELVGTHMSFSDTTISAATLTGHALAEKHRLFFFVACEHLVSQPHPCTFDSINKNILQHRTQQYIADIEQNFRERIRPCLLRTCIQLPEGLYRSSVILFRTLAWIRTDGIGKDSVKRNEMLWGA